MSSLLHNDLLGLDLVAVGELEHVHAGGGIHIDVADTVDFFGAQDAAGDVDDLEGAFTVDDDGAVADEGEVAAAVVASGEDQAEAAGVVSGVGLEAVARVGKHVNFIASHVVDEVEVGEFNILGTEADGVGAILFSLEVDRHFTHSSGVDHSVVFLQRDIDLGAVAVELELGQLTAFIEADDGAVDDVAAVAEVKGDLSTLTFRCGGCEGYDFSVFFSVNEDTFHEFDTARGGGHKLLTIGIHGIECKVVFFNVGNVTEGVTHKVPTGEINIFSPAQSDSAIAARDASNFEFNVFLIGVEIALTGL